MDGPLMKDILIVGIGNIFRRDDGAGIEVVRRLAARDLEGAELKEESGEGASLMEAWRGYRSVILVDAVSSGFPAGALHFLNPLEKKVPSEFFHYSTHAFSVAESVEMARALEILPERMWIYGIEGKDFGSGEGLTAEIERSVREVVRILEEFVTSNRSHNLLVEGDVHA